jgi:4-coumarate--CoA ligase
MGYLKNDVATRQAIDEDGYLHTGDLGSMDANRLMTIHDRIKELIKVPAYSSEAYGRGTNFIL